MLTFLTGTCFTEKKEYIYKEICSLIEKNERVYLIVPEQSSFDRDRDFLFRFGEKISNKLTVTSFTHLSRDVLEENGLKTRPEADEAARNVFMSIAVEECSDSIDIYRRSGARLNPVAGLLREYSEIKQAGLDTAGLYSVSRILPESTLKHKTEELARIFSAYEALLTQRFSDSADNIAVMCDFLSENKIFSGSYVYFDDFRGFTGAQIKLIEEIMSQAKECFVSVSAPSYYNSFDSEAFIHAVSNCRKLCQAASKRSVRVGEVSLSCTHPNKELTALAASLFCGEKEVYEDNVKDIRILSADNRYDECDFVALQIKKLLEKGLRCRDISVSDRSGEYVKVLTASLKKYSIPVFEDKRVPLYEYPIIKMLLLAVGICAYGFSTEDIFSYLKTGMTGISTVDCSALENYVYLWQIDTGAWLRDFTGNPEGFGEKETEETREYLARMNELRRNAVGPLLKLKGRLENNNGADSCRAVFEFLTEIRAAENFKEYARYLYESGNEAAAVECSSVWDTLTASLDGLYEAVSERSIKTPRFYELLKIILSSADVGRIPAGIDEIVIGTAGRTRHFEPKAVFVLGCNEGIFPQPPAAGGLFSPSERRILCDNEFPLENISENIYAEERMIAYILLTSPSDKLYLSYSKNTLSGAKAEPSELIGEIRAIFPQVTEADFSLVPSIDKIASNESAFEECAVYFSEASAYSESLKQFVSETPFANRLSVLTKVSEGAPAKINDGKLARELFGKDMYISPSKAEAYYSCAFRYFCQYGLNIKKLRPADLDARINGLLIHFLLENILVGRKNQELIKMSDAQLRAEIDRITEGFITDFMGGREDKGILLNRSLDKAKDTAYKILLRMIKEFEVSSFETVGVEVEIRKDGDVEPYKLILPDGGSITVSGKVDRVDLYKGTEKSYLRVVDYKTGGKDFKLGDVFSGLNMQMLIYLMCLWDNSGALYGETSPAGILYVPANASGEQLPRRADAETVEQQKLINGRMNGLILEDEKILDAMEKGGAGRFIKASVDSDGKLKGTFLSAEGFMNLHKKIDEMLVGMGSSLHSGNIEALPVIGSSSYKNTCTYCDYKDVCRRGENDAYRELPSITHKKAVEMLKGSENDG